MREGGESEDAMLDYLICLSDDSNDFSWQAVEACHAVPLCCMEDRGIVSYTQKDRFRRVHVQRHVSLNVHGYKVASKHDKMLNP